MRAFPRRMQPLYCRLTEPTVRESMAAGPKPCQVQAGALRLGCNRSGAKLLRDRGKPLPLSGPQRPHLKIKGAVRMTAKIPSNLQ